MSQRVVIAGCGFVGARLARTLLESGAEVWGISRSRPELPPGCHWLQADLTKPETLRANLPRAATHLIYAASAGDSSDARYEAVYVQGLLNLLHEVDLSATKRLFFVSSTATYHQDDGRWVDETSQTLPTNFAGVRTLQAEHIALSAAVPATILRCAGIYGPGRTRLIDSVRTGQATYDPNCPRYTNRIHRDDVAGALHHLMLLDTPESLYLGVDEQPAEQQDVLRFLAEQLNVSPPRQAATVSSRGGNKRCCGDKLRRSGYRFRFPTYREGYAALLAG